MIKPIYLYGEEALRKVSEDIDLDHPSLSSLIDDMFETMRNADGIGLAAPQIGINKRIIVIDNGEKEDEDFMFKGVFINAKILRHFGYLYKVKEGCLSFPGISERVSRPLGIEVEWYDENKKYHKEKFIGIKSIVLQHEIDHLNGILFIDKIDPEDKMRIYKDLENIKRKKVKVNYETK